MSKKNNYKELCDAVNSGKFDCADCKISTLLSSSYMLTDRLWLQIATYDTILCLDCANKRVEDKLGRELKYVDFSDAPVNDTILAAYMVGYRNAHREWAKAGYR